MTSKKSSRHPKAIAAGASSSVQLVTTGVMIASAFFLIMLLAADIIKQTALSALVLIMITAACRPKGYKSRVRLSAPLVGMAAYVLINGISTLYALSGKFAIDEFGKILVAFAAYIWIVFRNDGSAPAIRKAVTVFSAVSAALSFLSIEAASSRVLYSGFAAMMKPVSASFLTKGVFETGIRITSVLGNPNVFAGIAALSTLCSIYLLSSSKNDKQMFTGCTLLGVNALGFLLSFSMGATAVFFISVAVYIALSAPANRGANLVLMVETAGITLIMAGMSYVGLGRQGEAVSFLPTLAVLLQIGLLYFIHRFAGVKISARLANNGRRVLLVCGAVLLVLAAYAAAALNISTAYRFKNNEILRRGEYPDPGEYRLSVEGSGDVSVTIESQDMEQVMMHTSARLYSGRADGAVYTVPEGSCAVYFNFVSGNGETLHNAASTSLHSGKDTKIRLKYTLLPEFIANRMQGLNANQNAIQRTVFFSDGMKLFQKSPVFGLGLGSFEAAVKGVQDFYYETKYAHNHYIQMLVDSGLIGLALFLALILSSVYTLAKGRKNKLYADIFPMLGAALVMIAGHSMVEVVMSAAVYLPFAFALFALITVCYGEDIPGLAAVKWAVPGFKAYLAAFSFMFAVLLTGNLIAQDLLSKVTYENIYRQTEIAARLDVYETNDYLMTYVMNAPSSQNPEVLKQADLYAEKLSRKSSNVIHKDLVRYYFARENPDRAFETALLAVSYAGSDENTWMSLFNSFEAQFDPVEQKDFAAFERVQNKKDYYTEHILKIYDLLLERNRTRMGKIGLSTKNNIFLSKILQIKDLDNETELDAILDVFANRLFDSDYSPDLDGDGIPDLITGNVIREAGGLKLDGTAGIAVNHKVGGIYEMTVECDRPSALSFDVELSDIDIEAGDGRVTATFDLTRHGDKSDNVIRLTGKDVTIRRIEIVMVSL